MPHAGDLFVSAISAFEIGLKQKKGRLTLPLPAEQFFAVALSTHGLREVPVDGAIAARSTSLPPLHADPADRMIIATAQRDGLTILTPDPLIHAYPDTRVSW
jgi:PIN domain nuclease of toxin-antitoxin system